MLSEITARLCYGREVTACSASVGFLTHMYGPAAFRKRECASGSR
ncbi:hypothetical protein ACVW1A_006761 [Bradyrhizobium sp. LB1.3]